MRGSIALRLRVFLALAAIAFITSFFAWYWLYASIRGLIVIAEMPVGIVSLAPREPLVFSPWNWRYLLFLASGAYLASCALFGSAMIFAKSTAPLRSYAWVVLLHFPIGTALGSYLLARSRSSVIK